MTADQPQDTDERAHVAVIPDYVTDAFRALGEAVRVVAARLWGDDKGSNAPIPDDEED